MTMDATEQARLVRDGEVSPAELVDEAIERLERLNPQLNAVIHPLLDEARDAAAGELPDGPFRGVPFLVKDLSCYMKGVPVHEGMRAVRDAGYVADHDMVIAERLRKAGFVILGRTNVPELGILPTTEPVAYGPTHNPWDLERSPGGSSGGSAAAVAAGIVAAAHANDGGGSIRIPASHCGLVGLKPSRARVSLAPDFGDVMAGLVIELAVTRSVRDAAAILDAIQGPVPGDPYAAPPPDRPYVEEVGADPGRLRIGVMTTPPGGQFETHPECVEAARNAAAALEELGHHVEESHPAEMDVPELITNFIVRWTTAQDWNLKYWGIAIGRELGPDDVEPCTWALAEQGRSHTGGDLLRAIEEAQGASRRIAAWWAEDGFDLLLTPTCAEPPPRLGEFDAPPEHPLAPLLRAIPFGTFTAGFNTTGQPAISLPLHVTADGLPVGVQLVAAFGREDVLVRIATQLEEARPWAGRFAPVHADAA
ncbi:MAG TPA: amidase family protein [Solirubrobacteraceae bacterium]|nr:amidase family protein [Solirubrobacteraceae bacterium]